MPFTGFERIIPGGSFFRKMTDELKIAKIQYPIEVRIILSSFEIEGGKC